MFNTEPCGETLLVITINREVARLNKTGDAIPTYALGPLTRVALGRWINAATERSDGIHESRNTDKSENR